MNTADTVNSRVIALARLLCDPVRDPAQGTLFLDADADPGFGRHSGAGRAAVQDANLLDGQKTIIASVEIPGGERVVLSTSAAEASPETRRLVEQLLAALADGAGR